MCGAFIDGRTCFINAERTQSNDATNEIVCHGECCRYSEGYREIEQIILLQRVRVNILRQCGPSVRGIRIETIERNNGDPIRMLLALLVS